MISPLGGSRSPPAPQMEMHEPAGLLEIAAFVAILRNSIGNRSCSSAELVRMKQIRNTDFAAQLQATSRANVRSARGQ
jgi:hypothetical protein